jgi:hypothetical protein
MRWLEAVTCSACLCGCDLIFKLEPAVAPDAGSDGPQPDRPPGCSPQSLISDPFERAPFPYRPWFLLNTSPGTTTVNVDADALLASVQTADLEIAAEAFLQMKEQRVFVHLVHVGGIPSAGDQMTLDLLAADGSHRITYGARASANTYELTAGYHDLTTPRFVNIGSPVPYDPVTQPFLGIEHVEGVTRFLAGTAPDTLVPVFEQAVPSLDFIDFMRPSIFIHGSAGPLDYMIDSFNGGGAPTGEACPANTIRETFDGEPPLTDLQKFERNCVIAAVSAGELLLEAGEDSVIDSLCLLQTSTYFDLRGRSVTLDVKQFDSGVGANATARFVVLTRRNEARFELQAGQLAASALVNDLPQNLPADEFDPQEHALWRFTAAFDGKLLFEVGTREGAFRAFASTDLGPLDVVLFRIELTANGDSGAAFTIDSLVGSVTP